MRGRNFVRRLLGEESGAAIIEFALVTPLLLALVWGIIETGRAFYTVNSLASAVRDGARYGATCQLGAPPLTQASLTGSQCELDIRNMVVTGFQPIGPALLSTNVTATVVNGNRIRVEAQYPYAPIAPVTGWLFTLRRAAVFRYERLP